MGNISFVFSDFNSRHSSSVSTGFELRQKAIVCHVIRSPGLKLSFTSKEKLNAKMIFYSFLFGPGYNNFVPDILVNLRAKWVKHFVDVCKTIANKRAVS